MGFNGWTESNSSSRLSQRTEKSSLVCLRIMANIASSASGLPSECQSVFSTVWSRCVTTARMSISDACLAGKDATWKVRLQARKCVTLLLRSGTRNRPPFNWCPKNLPKGSFLSCSRTGESVGMSDQSGVSSVPKEISTMPLVASFYSTNERNKPLQMRVHHNNSACPPGRDIPADERRTGTGNYRLCEDCKRLNDQGR